MKLRLLVIGSMSNPHLKALCADFAARVKHVLPFDLIEIRDGKAREGDKRLQEEAAALRRKAEAPETGKLMAWACWDAQGLTLSSEGLSEWLAKRENESTRVLTWVIGSSHGLAPEFKRDCEHRLSLGAMTFTHEMARYLVLEQLYRALCIQRRLPYHH
jgi:23S rRNA (pseudouridine1915-N3)-methyltransferase